FGRLNRNILRHVFRDARIQGLVRKVILEGQIGVSGGNGSTAAGKIQIKSEGHDEKTKYQSDDEFHWLALPFTKFLQILTLSSASKFFESGIQFRIRLAARFGSRPSEPETDMRIVSAAS